jgi:Bacterial lectin
MGKRWRWIAMAVALAALTASPVWSQSERFTNSIVWLFYGPNTDSARNQWRLNGAAQWVPNALRLTGGGGQAASAFIKTPFNLSDYELYFRVSVRRVSPGETPADGFTFVAQEGDDNEIGASGGALGYASGGGFVLPTGARGAGIPGYSYAVEFNSYGPEGLAGAPETIALDILGLRTRFNQTPFPFVDVSHSVLVRVKPAGLTVSWLRPGDRNRNVPSSWETVYQSPPQMNGFFVPPRPLRLGFTAGTGAFRQIVDIDDVRLFSNQRLP